MSAATSAGGILVVYAGRSPAHPSNHLYRGAYRQRLAEPIELDHVHRLDVVALDQLQRTKGRVLSCRGRRLDLR